MEKDLNILFRLAATLFGISICTTSLAGNIQPGIYGDSLQLAVNIEKGTVSGIFESMEPDLVSPHPRQCKFYFSGHIRKNNVAEVVTVTNGVPHSVKNSSSGQLIFVQRAENAVILKLDSYPPGCSRSEDFASDTPSPRLLTEKQNWKEFRLVSAKRSHFHQSSTSKAPRKAYVTCGDPVMVLENDSFSGRSLVAFEGKTKVTEGWLTNNDLLPIGENLVCR